MDGERDLAVSGRLPSLAEKFHDKRYRDSYVAAHTCSVLARQMRNFRGERSQAEFAALIGKRQTVVSRLESPAYGSWTLRTMLEIARKENVAVFVRFVDFPTFLKYTGDLSENALWPASYDEEVIDELVKDEEQAAKESALKALFSVEPKQDTGRSAAVGATPQQDTTLPQVTFDSSREGAAPPPPANDATTSPKQKVESQAAASLAEAAD